MSNVLFFSKFCSVFAVFGVVIMFVFGYLFEKEPLYIKGIQDKAAAASGCYSASGLYFMVWIGSIFYWSYDSYKNRERTELEYTSLNMSDRGQQYGSVAPQ
jgi:hypothetical protein